MTKNMSDYCFITTSGDFQLYHDKNKLSFMKFVLKLL